MIKKIITFIFIIFANLNFAFADTATQSGFDCSAQKPENIAQIFSYFICILGRYMIPLLISMALVLFLAGIVKFVASGDSEEKRDAGKGLMLFGIISLFVMVSVWGLVRILYNTFFGSADTSAFPAVVTTPFK